MTDRSRNAIIGLFTLGGLASLGLLIVLFGESRGLFQREYPILARFEADKPPNIREGTEVMIAGVPVGNVGRIELVDPKIPSKGLEAELWIASKYQVPRGSVARVIIPLMGQPIVDIKPPSELVGAVEPVPRGYPIHGEVVNPLESVIDPKLMASLDKTVVQIGELAEALTPAARAVTGLLEKRTIGDVESPEAAIQGMTANLYTAVQRLYNVLTHFDTVLGDPQVQSNVKLTLDNFRVASEGVKVAVEDLKIFGEQAKQVAEVARGTMDKVDRTVVITQEHIDTLGRKLTNDAEKLSRMLDYFLSVGEQMAEGDGTAGMLLRDPKLYDELLLTFQRLGAAASEMQVLIREWQAQGIGFKMK
jgi:ABC-type transporter Mla subunit MlaD